MTPAGNDSSSEAWPIAMGGLMRCCIVTYVDKAPPAQHSTVGDNLSCQWCSSLMVLADGADGPVWRWDRPERPEGER